MWPLLLKYLADLRVLLAVALFVVCSAWYTDHAIAAHKRAKLEAEVARCTGDNVMLREAVASYDARLVALSDLTIKQNARVGELEEAGAALAAQLAEATRRHAAERRAWQVRMDGVLAPLPSDCEGAVREQARRLRETLRGVVR